MPDRLGWRKTSWWDGFTPSTQVSLSAFTWICGIFQTTVDGYIWGATDYRVAGFATQPTYAIWKPFNEGLYMIGSNKDAFTPGANGFMNWWGKRIFIPSGTQLFVGVLQTSAYYRSAGILPAGTGLTRNGIIMYNGFQSTSAAPWFTSPTGNQNANGISPLFSTWKD